MDPITWTIVGLVLGAVAVGYIWGRLKSWAERETSRIVQWLIDKGHIRTARAVQGAYGIVSTIGNFLNWGWSYVTSGSASEFLLQSLVSLGAEKWATAIEESRSNVPSEVKEEISEKGYYQLEVEA